MSYVYFSLAALFYTVSQVITFGKFRLKGAFWSSSDRKYKEPRETAPTTWYYKLAVLKYKERFLGSGTVLISLTDAYHMAQLFYKIALVASIVTYKMWLGWPDAIVYFVLFGVIFTATSYLVSARN